MRGFAFGITALLVFAPSAHASELAVNHALGGASGVAAAITDGDGSTTWCPRGTAATIDLGRPTALTGAGVTLAGKDSAVRVELSDNGRRWEPGAKLAGVAGGPAYARFDERARYARVTLADPDACVGEVRLFAPDHQLSALGS